MCNEDCDRREDQVRWVRCCDCIVVCADIICVSFGIDVKCRKLQAAAKTASQTYNKMLRSMGKKEKSEEELKEITDVLLKEMGYGGVNTE